MGPLTYTQVDDAVLSATLPPRRRYWVVMLALGAVTAYALSVWIYQVQTGMGVAGINHPVGWGVYIANFVFWVGIAHSGTLISAILHLVRSRWRSAVSRSAEAMTVFAVITAGLFPLIHLGRLWVFYFILPYPSQRQLWPNFTSALVWDVVAISTYLTVSTIFWYVGMIPDLASARDRWSKIAGPEHPRTRFYRRLSLGWTGSGEQWRHYGRSYLFFAALATPLVVSVHSVVSWDFATGILPGWHTTIFPPYFVAGAIHSGLAMVLTLVIPMRKLLRLEAVITRKHLEDIARTIIVTTLIVGYAYVIEPFIAWYSGEHFEQQFAWWRATGWLAWMYWAMFALNVFAPLAFLWQKARRNLGVLLLVSVLINLGMWYERYFIVVGSTAHDFLPHNWGQYSMSWVEWSITVGAFGWFMFWFVGFAKHLPTVAMAEVKETITEEDEHSPRIPPPRGPLATAAHESVGVIGAFASAPALMEALRRMRGLGYDRLETFSPVPVGRAAGVSWLGNSPVRIWTLVGALCGATGAFALAIGSAYVNSLIVGGKHTPMAYVAYCVVAFEGTVLLGSLANLIGMIVHGRLGVRRSKFPPPAYDGRFSQDRLGLFVACAPADIQRARSDLQTTSPETIRELR
jgi:molybdopterin-containing oxidoreductase family membrane subunit